MMTEKIDEMVERGLVHYSEGGCSGLSDYERREVVTNIISAALSVPNGQSEALTRWHDEFSKAFVTIVSEGEPRQYFIKAKFKTMAETHEAYRAMADLAAMARGDAK